MPKNPLFKKGLAYAVIVLFVGTSVIPLSAQRAAEEEDSYNQIMVADQTHEYKSQDATSSNPPNYFNIYEIAELGQTAWGLSAADFNHDGKMDFVAAYADVPFTHSTISIFYNNGNLSFTKDDVFTLDINYINDVVAGDFNNDGNMDILFTYDEWIPYQGLDYNVNGTANILFNDGTNHFGNLTMIVHRGNGTIDMFGRINPKIAAADYDMDGDLDFLWGDNSGQVEFFLNNGNTNFTSAGIIHDWGNASWGLTSADFDGDGDSDFLVAAEDLEGYGHIYLKLNQRIPLNLSGCFESSPGEIIGDISGSYPGTGSIAPMDYKNDGKIGFIFGTENLIYLYKKEGPGAYSRHFIYQLPNNPEGYSDVLNGGAVATADFNNDGYPDFVAGGVQGIIRLFINDHSQNFSYPPETPIIKGSTHGNVGVSYKYKFMSTDPEGDNVYYLIFLGPYGTGWIGPYPSGKEVIVNYTFTKKGTYKIFAQAMDIHGDTSDWATLQVTMPLSYEPPHFRFFEWLFERFPHAFPILRYFLDK